jgi:elongation factor G
MQKIVWDDETLGASYTRQDLSPAEQTELAPHREQLLETLAEVDDQIMEAYLNETPIPADMLETAIRQATIDLKRVPVLCGSALKNKGIQPCWTLSYAICPARWMYPPSRVSILTAGKP